MSSMTVEPETMPEGAEQRTLEMAYVAPPENLDDYLRGCDPQNSDFQWLMDNIRLHGLINPINVRPKRSKDGKVIPGFYTVTDGLQRYSACKLLGWTKIPTYIVDVPDEEVLARQMAANLNRVEMKPAQWGEKCRRWLMANPRKNKEDLAKLISRSVTWVDQRLKLNILPEDIKKEIDNGEITAMNGWGLSKLYQMRPAPPQEILTEAVNRAATSTQEEFLQWVDNTVQVVREAQRAGITPSGKRLGRTPKLRKLNNLIVEHKRIDDLIERLRAEVRQNLDEASVNEICRDITLESFEDNDGYIAARKAAVRKYIDDLLPQRTLGYLDGLKYVLQIDDRSWTEREAKKREEIEERERKKQREAAGELEETFRRAGLDPSLIEKLKAQAQGAPQAEVSLDDEDGDE